MIVVCRRHRLEKAERSVRNYDEKRVPAALYADIGVIGGADAGSKLWMNYTCAHLAHRRPEFIAHGSLSLTMNQAESVQIPTSRWHKCRQNDRRIGWMMLPNKSPIDQGLVVFYDYPVKLLFKNVSCSGRNADL